MRRGSVNSQTREQLIDAALEIIQEQGTAAVTAGRIAGKLGLKRQIVHYYFGTLEDLFVAIMRRAGEQAGTAYRRALEADDPLRAIWETSSNVPVMMFEFLAMAMHQDYVRAEVVRYAEMIRELQTQAIARHLKNKGLEPDTSPALTALIVAGIAQMYGTERALGIGGEHGELAAFIDRLINAFEKNGKILTV